MPPSCFCVMPFLLRKNRIRCPIAIVMSPCYEREQQLGGLEKELANTKGVFKGKQRKELQEQIGQLQTQIENMKRYLPSIVQGYGYKNVKEFLAEYKASKAEYGDYRKAVAEWEKLTGEKVDDSLRGKLQRIQQQEKS